MKPPVVIIGAGISGLALGWALKQQDPDLDLVILEKNHRPGGWIETIHTENFLFEQGPRSCRTSGTGLATLQLVEELGLQDEVIFPSPAAKRRYLYTNHQLQALPSGLLSLIFSRLMKDLLPALWNDLKTAASRLPDETVFDFFSRRFSPEIAEKFIDPLCSGIYAGDIRSLSVSACFPLLYKWEQEHGSILKGMWRHKKHENLECSSFVKKIQKHSLFTFKNGMEVLVHKLHSNLTPHIQFHSPVKAILTEADGLKVLTETGKAIHAAHVFDTRPCPQISMASVAVVSMGWHEKVLRKEGFGYLIPSKEKQSLLGIVWDSSAFPQQNRSPNETRLTAMVGGSHMADFPSCQPEKLIEISLRSIKEHLQISLPPKTIRLKIARHAIPQYHVGHLRKISEIDRTSPPGVTLLGSSLYGVSVNDCVHQARVQARAYLEKNRNLYEKFT